jgi:hypothetical protein
MQWFLADKERQVVDKKADEKIEKILNAYQEANSEVI